MEASYRGLTLAGPAREFSITPALIEGYYEQLEISLFERLAPASRTIIDVGANIGLYACSSATHLIPGGRVIAFEPIPENLGYLRLNLDRNKLRERVDVEAAAVGDGNGEVTIRWGGNAATVPMVSLDSYAATHDIGAPDIIKIDVEGLDGAVLRGARSLLESARPTLFVEFLPALLMSHGFEPNEFLDIIFSQYSHVFTIDELCQEVARCSRSDLARVGGDNNPHAANLLAINRQDHLGIIQRNRQDRVSERGPCFTRIG